MEEPQAVEDPDSFRDADVILQRTAVDIMVRGCAYTQTLLTEFAVGISVGSFTRSIAIVGDRSVTQRAFGKLHFSDPTPIHAPVPLV